MFKLYWIAYLWYENHKIFIFYSNSDDHFAIAVVELAFVDENWQKKNRCNKLPEISPKV
jgi:hypothetical protein